MGELSFLEPESQVSGHRKVQRHVSDLLTLVQAPEARTPDSAQPGSDRFGQFALSGAKPTESVNAQGERVLKYPGGCEITFDERGRVISIKTADGERKFTWDEHSSEDKLIGVKVTLTGGKVYVWHLINGKWNCDKQQHRGTFSLDRQGVYEFTIDGVRTVRRPEGVTEKYRNGVLEQRSFAGGLVIEYRPDGKISKTIDTSGTTRSFTYGSDGQLSKFVFHRRGHAATTYELTNAGWMVNGKPADMTFRIEPYVDPQGNGFDQVYSFTDTKTGARYYVNPLGTEDAHRQDGSIVQYRNGVIRWAKDGRVKEYIRDRQNEITEIRDSDSSRQPPAITWKRISGSRNDENAEWEATDGTKKRGRVVISDGGREYGFERSGVTDLVRDGRPVQRKTNPTDRSEVDTVDGRIIRTSANGVIREFQWAKVQRGHCEIVSETITQGGKSVTWTRQKEGDVYTDRWLSSGNPPEQREGVLTIDETGQSTFGFQRNGVSDHRVLVTKNDGTTVLKDFYTDYQLYRNKDGLVFKVHFADGTIREYTWSKDQHGKDVVQALKISKHEKLLSTWARIGSGRYRSNTGRVWEVDFEVTDAGVHSVIHGNANTPTYRYFPDGRIEIDNKRPGESRHVVTSNGARIERVQLGSRARHVTTDEIRDEITHTKWTKQPRKGQDGTGEFVWIPSRIDDSQPYTGDQGERTGTVDLLSTGTYSFKDREGVRIVHTSDGRVIKMDQAGLRAEIERTFRGDESKQIRERLVRNLALVEKRAAVDVLTYGERSEAYYQAYRLLDARGQTGEKPFNEADRRVLFEQLMWAYAHPRMQHQGYHRTCGLTAPRACMLLKEPSVVGRVVADVVTTGKFRTKDDVVIAIDKRSLEPDDEARRSWPSRHLNPRLDPIGADWPANHLDPASRGIRVERENGYGPLRKVIDVSGRIYEVIPDKGDPDVIDQVIMPHNWPPPGVSVPAGAVWLKQGPHRGRYALVARNGQIRLDLENGTITQTPASRVVPSAMVRIEQSPWPPAEQRLWLGQIFDLTAGNIACKQRFFDPEYNLIEIGTLSYGQRQRTRQEDTGERVWALKPDGTYREYPYYHGTKEYEMSYIYRQMGARRPLTTLARVDVDDVEQFREMMTELNKNGGFPIVLTVHTSHPPFNRPVGGLHAIPIYGYDPAQDLVYGGSNWGTANFPASRDTTGRVRSRGVGLKTEQLFTAMR